MDSVFMCVFGFFCVYIVLCFCSCRKQQQHNALSTTISAFDSLLSLATVVSEALQATVAVRPPHRLSRRDSHFDVVQRIDSKSATTLCVTAIHLVKQNLFWMEDEAAMPHLSGCDRLDTEMHVACVCIIMCECKFCL